MRRSSKSARPDAPSTTSPRPWDPARPALAWTLASARFRRPVVAQLTTRSTAALLTQAALAPVGRAAVGAQAVTAEAGVAVGAREVLAVVGVAEPAVSSG